MGSWVPPYLPSYTFSLLHPEKLSFKREGGQVLVAHSCNPCYSGGRDQEDHGSKPAQANSSTRSYLKKILHKKGLVEWLKV
jgi:hypothetical protein